MIHVYPRLNSSKGVISIPLGKFSDLTTVMIWLCGGLIGTGLTGQAAWAKPVLNDTSHFLLAQQVVNGLPPPPPVIFGQEALATGQSRTVQPQVAQQYLVVVNGDSQMLLSQVQQVQPSASVQEYNGQSFIQAGLFNDATSAQQQVSTLAAAGIGAQVLAVTNSSSSLVSQTPTGTSGSGEATYDPNSTGVNTLPPPEALPTTTVPSSPNDVQFGSSAPASAMPSSTGDQAPRGSRAYYVVIPSSSQNISSVTTQISRLTQGMGIDNMVQTGTARGSHVRVGPFNSRSAANRWTRYFRDFGMDARVNFSR